MMTSQLFTIALERLDGGWIHLSPFTLAVWIDETGHEEFADPDYPLFGLGGCACLASQYAELIDRPWRALKAEHFGGADASMHASELREPTQAQLNALGHFFHTQPFARVAGVISDETVMGKQFPPYQLAASILLKRVNDVIPQFQTLTDVALIVEQSQRGDTLARKYLDAYRYKVTDDKGSQRMLGFQAYFAPKMPTSFGLEIADFIMHAVGGQVRTRLQTTREPQRRDFKAVFQPDSVDWGLARMLEITEVRTDDPSALGSPPS